MKTLLTIPNALPLWQSANKKWQIEKINNRELAITDGFTVCYAYISKDYSTLIVDRKIYPKYVETKAIKLAKKHILTIY